MYAITVDLVNKECVVIGGGKVAFRKIRSLLAAGAAITVISPEVCQEIRQLQALSQVRVIQRKVEASDYADAFLIIAATNAHEVNEEIAVNVKGNQLLNVVTNPSLGNFHVPASFSRGRLKISVSTEGASPYLAKKIRDQLKNEYDESYEDYLDFLYACREKVNNSYLDAHVKSALLIELIHPKYKDHLEERSGFLNKLNDEAAFFQDERGG